MNKLLTTLACVAMIAAMPTGANAQTRGGEASIWGMAVLPTNGDAGGGTCNPTGEFCADVPGWGASASGYFPTNGSLSWSADMLYEYHRETNAVSADRNDHASYGSLGVHLTNEANPDMPWGGFAFFAGGANHADNSDAGPVFGLGAEIMVSGFVIQAGGMELIDKNDPSADTLENMVFAGVSKEFPIWKGTLSTGAMVGFGDWDDDSDQNAWGDWAQLNLFYEAPLGNGNLHWFAGYQMDYVHYNEDGDAEQGIFHAVKLGINIPLGAGAGPFKTPNFRAPLVNAGELN